MSIPAPPRRKSIPDHVKVAVLLTMLGLKGKTINWSHEPALGLRAINDDGTDYKPAQLDPDYIFARIEDDHDHLTFKDNGSGRSDLGAIAHTKRLVQGQQLHGARIAARVNGDPKPEPKRRKIKFARRPKPWAKGRKIHGRGFLRQARAR